MNRLPPPLPPKKKKKAHREEDVEESSSEELEGVTQKEYTEAVRLPDVSGIQARIAKLLKFSTFEPEQQFWLDTGSVELNKTLGSGKKGLPYGKIYELRGPEHGGKTTLSTVIAGLAQRDGAAVGYIDLENSRDSEWAKRLGLDFDGVLPIYPKLIRAKAPKRDQKEDAKVGKKSSDVLRLQGAEELFAEAETGMSEFYNAGYVKQFWFLDSVANLTTTMAVEAGVDRNMRVNMDRAMFLSNTLPMWAGLAANYNAMIFLLNQLRDKPGVVYGNPEYSPGGRALRHACAIRANVRRVKNGFMRHNSKVVGIKMKVSNFKNKAGEGSVEQEVAGVKVRWDKSPARIQFMDAGDLEKEA